MMIKCLVGKKETVEHLQVNYLTFSWKYVQSNYIKSTETIIKLNELLT